MQPRSAVTWVRSQRPLDLGVSALLAVACFRAVQVGVVSERYYAVLPFAALLFVRRAPLVITTAVASATGLIGGLVFGAYDALFGYTAAGLAVCSYLAVRYVPDRFAALPGGLGVALALTGGVNLASAATIAALMGGGAASLQGFASRTAASEGMVARLRTRAQEQEREQAWLAQRAEVARELHDIVGHHVTAIVVSAEAAKTQGPDGHRQGLDKVAELGRTALAELDVLVRSLRDDGSAPTRAIPRLSDLPALMEPLRAAGISADLTTMVTSRLDDTQQLAVYRVVQEATTNILKHAKATTARIDVVERDDELTVRVTDDGTGESDQADLHGRGLLGIGERVDALGGSWSYQPVPGTGTTVTATLPVGSARR